MAKARAGTSQAVLFECGDWTLTVSEQPDALEYCILQYPSHRISD